MNSTLKFSISQEGIDCLLGETEKNASVIILT